MSITFNGISSDDMNLIIQFRPNQIHANRRVTTQSVEGKYSDYIIDDDTLENYTQPYDCYIERKDETFENAGAAVAEWLIKPAGYQRLEDTYEPDIYRRARFIGPLDLDNLLNTVGTATIEFDCDPRRFLKSGELPFELLGAYSYGPYMDTDTGELIPNYGTSVRGPYQFTDFIPLISDSGSLLKTYITMKRGPDATENPTMTVYWLDENKVYLNYTNFTWTKAANAQSTGVLFVNMDVDSSIAGRYDNSFHVLGLENARYFVIAFQNDSPINFADITQDTTYKYLGYTETNKAMVLKTYGVFITDYHEHVIAPHFMTGKLRLYENNVPKKTYMTFIGGYSDPDSGPSAIEIYWIKGKSVIQMDEPEYENKATGWQDRTTILWINTEPDPEISAKYDISISVTAPEEATNFRFTWRSTWYPSYGDITVNGNKSVLWGGSETGGGVLTNPSNEDSKPLLRIYMSGAPEDTYVYVNDYTIKIDKSYPKETGHAVIGVDCESTNAYYNGENCNKYVSVMKNGVVADDYPVLPPGESTFSGSNYESIQLYPKWWRR